MDSTYITGTCCHMCPVKEVKLRESQKLLHIFEVVPGTERDGLPKADFQRCVKMFSRSAAGKSFIDPENLRPAPVLIKTVNYLLTEIISKEADWILKYNFIMDRLRSVRQDMVIQSISRAHQIIILQPIIRFYAYAAYKSCEETIHNFDPYINNSHLQECLKRLLCMYDYYDHLQEISKERIIFSNQFLEENRPYFETLYLIFNLGDVHAINRVLNIRREWKTSLVMLALEANLSYVKGNYIRLFRILKRMPVTIQIAANMHIAEIRRLVFKTMSVAYSNKNLSYSKQTLMETLAYNSEDELISDCHNYGIKVNENGVSFIKTEFKDQNSKVRTRRSKEIDQKLNQLDISTFCFL